MKNFKTFVAVLFIGLFTLTACAPTRQSVQPAPTPPPEIAETSDAAPGKPTVSRREILDSLSHFKLWVLTEPDEPCPGPDGKHMIHLGRNHQVQLVLGFPRGAPPGVKSENLVARINGMNAPFPFIKRIAETEFATARTRLDFLESGLNIGPAGISLFYNDDSGKTFLGSTERVIVDTHPPPRPINIKIPNSGADFFEVTWDLETAPETMEIKEIIIKKMTSGSWQSVWRGSSLPPVTAPSTPVGSFRIVVVDCALNRSWTDFTPDILAVTRRACRENREIALAHAKKMIEEAFFEEYVQPGLKDRADRISPSWIPPGIMYASPDNSNIYNQGGETCLEVTGQLNRKRFNGWLEERLTLLENRKKPGIRLHARGPGADILASLFKSRFASRGFAVYDQSDAIDFEPAGSLSINVTIGPPSSLSSSMVNLYCWHVRAAVDSTSESGRRIHFTHMDVDNLDAKIFGSTLHQAIYNPGPNSFTERIGKPMLNEFLRRWP